MGANHKVPMTVLIKTADGRVVRSVPLSALQVSGAVIQRKGQPAGLSQSIAGTTGQHVLGTGQKDNGSNVVRAINLPIPTQPAQLHGNQIGLTTSQLLAGAVFPKQELNCKQIVNTAPQVLVGGPPTVPASSTPQIMVNCLPQVSLINNLRPGVPENLLATPAVAQPEALLTPPVAPPEALLTAPEMDAVVPAISVAHEEEVISADSEVALINGFSPESGVEDVMLSGVPHRAAQRAGATGAAVVVQEDPMVPMGELPLPVSAGSDLATDSQSEETDGGTTLADDKTAALDLLAMGSELSDYNLTTDHETVATQEVGMILADLAHFAELQPYSHSNLLQSGAVVDDEALDGTTKLEAKKKKKKKVQSGVFLYKLL